MNIENPKYNPVCRVHVNRFVLQIVNGSRTKFARHTGERSIENTDFFKHIKMSAADFIKRKI